MSWHYRIISRDDITLAVTTVVLRACRLALSELFCHVYTCDYNIFIALFGLHRAVKCTSLPTKLEIEESRDKNWSCSLVSGVPDSSHPLNPRPASLVLFWCCQSPILKFYDVHWHSRKKSALIPYIVNCFTVYSAITNDTFRLHCCHGIGRRSADVHSNFHNAGSHAND